MSESSPPFHPEGLDRPDGARLSVDEIERILDQFRAWLSGPAPSETLAPGPKTDLATLVNAFTAMRHEVNLQTKASRSQLEQLNQVVDEYRKHATANSDEDDDAESTDDKTANAVEETLRPVFKAILDAHDALSVAHREVTKMRAAPRSSRNRAPIDAPPKVSIHLPWWARWMGLGRRVESALKPLEEWKRSQSLPDPVDDSGSASDQAMVDSLLAGYAMSMNRLERLLEQFGFEAIDCVGCRFDPELMEVLDVVREEGRTETEVIAELRRGYIRDDRVFRYAQVRVARP